jgi:uncharacterized repeat protein (TIGR01451 family)
LVFKNNLQFEKFDFGGLLLSPHFCIIKKSIYRSRTFNSLAIMKNFINKSNPMKNLLPTPDRLRSFLQHALALPLLLLCLHAAAQPCTNDVVPPACVAPANVTVTCETFDPSLASYGTATATDDCCMDTVIVTTNYNAFSQYCNNGTIYRTFKAYDCSGNSAVCVQNIVSNFVQDYFVRFPNDLIITAFSPTGNYGEPVFFGEDCELMGISYEDQVFTDIINSEIRIERTWTVINWCTYDPLLGVVSVPNAQPNAIRYHASNLPGATVSAAGTPAPWNPTIVKIHPNDPAPTNYSTFYNAAANGYKYKQYIYRTDTVLTGITGYVYSDSLLNCAYDAGEHKLPGWQVRVKGLISGYTQVVSSDPSGQYGAVLPENDTIIEVSVLTPFGYNQYCGPDTVYTTVGQSVTQDVAVQLESSCPLMAVDLAAPILRRCFPGHYNVSACNLSVAPINDVHVEVALDPYLVYNSSTIPGTLLSGNTYSFPLGTMGIGECRYFTIDFTVSCEAEIGATHCTEAHIFPDSLCRTSSEWSGADVQVRGYCEGDSVRMNIANRGTGDMTQALDFVVVEDIIMLQGGTFQLNKNEEYNIKFPANGATWRLQADQEPHHPWGGSQAVAVEGCGGLNQTGLVTQLALNDENPFIATDCRQNVGSYDPNDKQAVPTGFGANHLLEANTDIEYMIRFQNTGTDTAFTVVVLDTLSNYLNALSVRPGASSHKFSFDILNDKVLRFTFDNILLPDSNVNEAASHGFVKFRVNQKPNNVDDTRIENSAAIYFDFNSPVITNTVFHTIGSHFVVVSTTPGPSTAAVRVYPNPASDAVMFELPQAGGQFTLTNQLGQAVRSLRFNQQTLRFERGNLDAGVYFFQIQTDNQQVFTGKIMLK